MLPHPRLLPLAGAGVLVGTALQLQQRDLVPLPWPWWGGASGLALWLLVAFLRGLGPGRTHAATGDLGQPGLRPRNSVRFALAAAAVVLGGLLLGHAQAELRARDRLDQRLDAQLEGAEVIVTGVIATLPTRRADGVRLKLMVESGRRVDTGAPVVLPALLSLGWYRDRAVQDADAAPPSVVDPTDLRAGERWRLRVRLFAPHGLVNPGGFDYELWLFEQGIGAVGTVRGQRIDAARRLDAAAAFPVERLRQWLRDQIQARLGNTRAAGVVAALCVGDQAGISREDWDLFRATGVAHLVAISGVHLTMLAWLTAALVGPLWSRSMVLTLALPAPHAARLGGAAVAFGYAMLAGWGVPAQRTVLMVVVASLTPLLGLRWPWPFTLGLAALVVTLLDPWCLLQPGFWLSFVAVGLLMLQGDPPLAAEGSAQPLDAPAAEAPSARAAGLALLRAGGQQVAAAVRTQAVATLGLAPLSLLFFHQLALLGFVANLVAIPLVTLVITPLVLLGCVVPVLWQAAAWLVDLQSVWLAWLSGVPQASWRPAVAPLWAQALALVGAFVVLAPGPRALRLAGLPLLLPLLWPALALPAAGRFELLGADVGQGQAVLVRTRHHTLLYDTGAQYSRESDAGERVLVPLLRDLGIAPLDVLMLSHRDSDHVGGARAVLAGVGAQRLVSSLEAQHVLRVGRDHTPCLAGQRWQWDGVSFEVMHPTERDYARFDAGHLRPNALSCVLRVDDGQRSALLLGDIEQPQELALVERAGALLATDVMLVAHHGSRTSSDATFLRLAAPRWGLIQAGHHNRYGHPADDVVERLRSQGIALVRTDVCGAWHWRSADAQNWCERDRAHRYWHAPLRGDGLELARTPVNNTPP